MIKKRKMWRKFRLLWCKSLLLLSICSSFAENEKPWSKQIMKEFLPESPDAGRFSAHEWNFPCCACMREWIWGRSRLVFMMNSVSLQMNLLIFSIPLLLLLLFNFLSFARMCLEWHVNDWLHTQITHKNWWKLIQPKTSVMWFCLVAPSQVRPRYLKQCFTKVR